MKKEKVFLIYMEGGTMNRIQQQMDNPYIHDAAHEQILLKRYE